MNKKLIIIVISLVFVIAGAIYVINKDKWINTSAKVENEFVAKSTEDTIPEVIEKEESVVEIKADKVVPEEKKVDLEELVYAMTTVNVRADSEETSEIIGQLYLGDSVVRREVLDNGWSRVEYNGCTGFIKSNYLSDKVPVVAEATQNVNSDEANSISTTTKNSQPQTTTMEPEPNTNPLSKTEPKIAHNHWGEYIVGEPMYGKVFINNIPKVQDIMTTLPDSDIMTVKQYNELISKGKIGTFKYYEGTCGGDFSDPIEHTAEYVKE